MRILIACDTYYPHVNGASYFTQRLAHGLASRGHEVAVLAPSESFKNTDSVQNGVHVFGVRSIPILFYPKFRFVLIRVGNEHIKRVLREFKPDVLHLQMHFTISAEAAVQARRLRIPVVATNHFMPDNLVHYLHMPGFIERAISRLLWVDCARVLRKLMAVTSPSHFAARLLEQYLHKPVLAISCGIDLAKFNRAAGRGELATRYNIPSIPVLLSVSRLDKEKNIDIVLRAAAKALKQVDFCFVIAGNGAERKNLEKLAQTLDISHRVIFAGFVPDEDLPQLYNNADCFVTASTAELQGITVMEAMASGLPVVSARAVALPELVHHEQNGFLFVPGAVDELAGRLREMFSDRGLRERMSEKSLEIIGPHDINRTFEAFEALYKKVIDEK